MTLPRALFGIMLVIMILPFSCSPPKGEEGKKVLTIWTTGDSKNLGILKQTTDDFEKLHPDTLVHINFVASKSRVQKYLISMQAGTSADIILFHWSQVPVFAPKHALLDLMPFIEKDNYDLSDFFEDALGAYQYGDAQYCLPTRGSTMVLYYNKDRFF